MNVVTRNAPSDRREKAAGGLETPLRELPGVSLEAVALVAKAIGIKGAPVTVGDVLRIRPREIVRVLHTTLSGVRASSYERVAVALRRRKIWFESGDNPGTVVTCVDENGEQVDLKFHGIWREAAAKLLPATSSFFAVGKVTVYGTRRLMRGPDIWRSKPPEILPRYWLTEGLTAEAMWTVVGECLSVADQARDPLPSDLVAKFRTLRRAFHEIHRPGSLDALDPAGPAVQRLALDELAWRIAQQTRPRPASTGNTPRAGDGRLVTAIRDALPFALTPGQYAAVADILNDLRSASPMRRLLMGDVGSGKTIVALLAMAAVVEVGRQAAMMAPTEILASQHFGRLRPVAEAVGLRVGLLTGSTKAADRWATLAALAVGEIDIVFGTQALIQKGVQFRDLGLAVVDEQHRFGVKQRHALAQMGTQVDQLALTATPSPRSLALAEFGDVDVSELRDKPPGRQPIDTRSVSLERLDEVVDALGRTIATGARVFWVCPLVDKSEKSDIGAATERYQALRQVFGDRVGLVHGKMAGRDKDAAMAAFARGDTDILVATTVIEVGVDVPEATVMVIEHAERFGLAQLHQLRGRVGRGTEKSNCLLLYQPDCSDTARARIDTLRRTEDGFEIAEEDLRLRGEGDVLGSSQSGKSPWAFFDPAAHKDLALPARIYARAIARRSASAPVPSLTHQRRGERGDSARGDQGQPWPA